jgi:hypothetical protein
MRQPDPRLVFDLGQPVRAARVGISTAAPWPAAAAAS